MKLIKEKVNLKIIDLVQKFKLIPILQSWLDEEYFDD